MNEAEFMAQAEATMMQLEDAIDTGDGALDYESNGSVLTIECEDSATQVIISRQLATREIWVAAKSGGYHLGWQAGQWHCASSDESLIQLLERVLTEQSDGPVSLGHV
ncbi:MAG: iron donor protein CyaY [Cellvibrionaceae bacterium]|nr:iron donor protein CyaY [Cellvibrionaceae bacterium]MCV6627311.1 iron donor protein CyaY [Cellvibrionaceae bacterium]